MNGIVLAVTMVGTVLGISKCTSVIFESENHLASLHLNRDDLFSAKQKRVMPKLWAPMLQAFLGEAILILMLLSGFVDGSATGMLFLVIAFFFLAMLYLGRSLYLAGRDQTENR